MHVLEREARPAVDALAARHREADEHDGRQQDVRDDAAGARGVPLGRVHAAHATLTASPCARDEPSREPVALEASAARPSPRRSAAFAATSAWRHVAALTVTSLPRRLARPAGARVDEVVLPRARAQPAPLRACCSSRGRLRARAPRRRRAARRRPHRAPRGRRRPTTKPSPVDQRERVVHRLSLDDAVQVEEDAVRPVQERSGAVADERHRPRAPGSAASAEGVNSEKSRS